MSPAKPAGHSSKHSDDLLAPANDAVPAGQSVQIESDVAPVVTEYLPTSHFVQEASENAPFSGEYFPTPHMTHVALDEAPDLLEYLPGAQSTQILAPSSEYVPTCASTNKNHCTVFPLYISAAGIQKIQLLAAGGCIYFICRTLQSLYPQVY